MEEKEKSPQENNELVKSSLDNTVKAVERNLENVDNVIKERNEHITKMPDTVLKNLDPNELNITSRNINLDTGTLFTFKDLKKGRLSGYSLEDELADGITAAAATLNSFMPNGNHAFIRMVDQNIYLGENFPALEESLQLFIDSCVNGSYTGDPLASSKTPFKYYDKSGAEITDVNDIARFNELLMPTRANSVNLESFFDIEVNIRKRERRDGMALVRYVQFRKVLKELYIKFLLKKTKVNKTLKKEKVVRIAKLPDVIPRPEKPHQKGFETTTLFASQGIYMTENHLKKFGYTSEQISGFESLVETKVDKVTELSAKSKRYEYELTRFANESFMDFVERYVTGGTEKLLDYRSKTVHGSRDADGTPLIKNMTYGISTDAGRFSDETANEILGALRDSYAGLHTISTFGTESASSEFIGIESVLENNDILDRISFDDIYNTQFPDNFNINHISRGFESTEDGFINKPYIENEVQQLFYDTAILLDIDYKQIGMETFEVGTMPDAVASNYLLNHRDGAPKPPRKQIISQDKVNDNAIAQGDNIKEPDETTVKEQIPHGRIEKLFASVKGGVVEILDGQRAIPVMPGKRVLGAFYITHSHELMRNLLLTRQFMTQPQAFMNLVDSEYEYAGSQEELVGRLIFSDYLRPLIEKNMSTKFLRENADVMYTIQKIIEDQDLSNSMSYSDIANYNMVNLSRISFIPASELHVARNTNEGFGESFFQKARVPANFRIIANEAYLAWVIHDGKPINVIKVQSGLADGGGMFGVNNAMRQFAAHKMTRGGLRRINGRGQSITAETIVYQSQGTDDIVQHTQIPGYELRIEKDMMRQWETEATSIVGFNSALFTSEDGRIELARKLADLDEIQTSKIFHEQRRNARPASDRATRLLHLRGGDDVKDITVEYLPPYLVRDNNVKQSETLKEVGDTLEALKGIYESKYEDNELYQEVKPYIWNTIMERMNVSDVLVTGSDEILDEAKRKKEATESMMAKETK